MTISIVAAAGLSHNDVFLLARLFKVSFDFFLTYTSPQVEDFLLNLRTIGGLGMTASLADHGGVLPYQTSFNRFCSERGNFRKSIIAPSLWASTMVDMVAMGLDSFRRLNYPGYYSDFLDAVESSIKNIRVDIEGETKNAEKILALLPDRRRRRG